MVLDYLVLFSLNALLFLLQNDNFVRVRGFYFLQFRRVFLRCATFQQKRNTHNLKQLKNTSTKKRKKTHFVRFLCVKRVLKCGQK